MLNKVEIKIMDYVFAKCKNKKSVLLTPKEILQTLIPKYELTAKQLDAALKNISLDGYIDVLNSDNKGNLVYLVSLKSKGEAYQREREDARAKILRSIYWKVGLTVGGAVLSFIVGTILLNTFR